MAIQMRRGTYSNFDPTRLVPGEIAVVMSGHSGTDNGAALYVCLSQGYVARFGTWAEVEELVGDATDGLSDLKTEVQNARSVGDGVTYASLGAAVRARFAAIASGTGISDGAITTAKLASKAVTSAKMADGAVTSTQLGSNAATTAKIADGAVTTAKLANLGVTEGKLANGAVTTGKLADGAVSSAKVASGYQLMTTAQGQKLDGIEEGANAYVHPSYTARTGKPTGNQTPAFGETFPVSQIVTDAQGHVTAATDRTVRIPDTEASQSAHGLMSAADKKALDAIKATSGNKLHRLVTAPVVTASDAYAVPPVALVVDGKSVQDGTPTPDAPVAIQSVESVGLGAAGKNLYSTPLDSSGKTSNGITWTVNADGSITANGTATGFSYIRLLNRQNMGNLVMGQTYVLSGAHDGVRHLTNQTGHGDISSANPLAITLTEGLGFTISLCVTNGTTVDNVTVHPQIELGSTATPYQPYVGSTTPIPLDGHALRSLPDGTHDELRVDADGAVTLVQRVWAETFDGSSDESWQLSGQGIATTKYNNMLLHAASNNVAVSMLSSHLTVRTSNEIYGGSNPVGVAVGASGVLRVGVYGESTTLANTVAWLAENPLTILAPLATPVEIPLGTVSLPSMPAPDLTAWASCTPATEIELDYERDVSLVIAQLEAQIAEIATA